MKVSIPEPVAAGAIKALEESNNPDVRHLVRELKQVVDSRTNNDQLTAQELGEVIDAIDHQLVREGATSGTKLLLRTARPKVIKLRDRQALREREQ